MEKGGSEGSITKVSSRSSDERPILDPKMLEALEMEIVEKPIAIQASSKRARESKRVKTSSYINKAYNYSSTNLIDAQTKRNQAIGLTFYI